ncbi:MAG: type II toxin-antitoxin system RelE/ParE family toxin [Gammaproteobacteria bacterium]|nr:type II toxin-antitoxin system RelE/ParE family toxin [Gammaproteobacteria bacterium]MCH9744792.1 type II toxin-antitoxin system RelE/ParE family toxin [Gammaproteobacteria bacterium]
MERELVFYRTPRGKVPLRKWLEKINDMQASARIRKRLRRMERGVYGDCKHLREGVWELRIDEGPGYRIYFAELRVKMVVLLLSGGTKRTQKKDITHAIKYFKNYKVRFEDDETK